MMAYYLFLEEYFSLLKCVLLHSNHYVSWLKKPAKPIVTFNKFRKLFKKSKWYTWDIAGKFYTKDLIGLYFSFKLSVRSWCLIVTSTMESGFHSVLAHVFHLHLIVYLVHGQKHLLLLKNGQLP